MAVLPAHRVATPVLERLEGGAEVRGPVLGVGATAAWVDLDGFVVAVTTREVPLLPNAVALAAGSGVLARAGVAAGATARATAGGIELGPTRVVWDRSAPPAWDPTVSAPPGPAPAAVARRGAAILHALGVWRGSAEAVAEGVVDSREPPTSPSATLPVRGPHQRGGAEEAAQRRGAEAAQRRGAEAAQPGVAEEAAQRRDQEPTNPSASALVRELARIGLPTAFDPDGAAALELLLQAVAERDPGRASGAARGLLGRGPGLTPEGDDLVAAVAGTLAVLGPAAGLQRRVLAGLRAALALVPGTTTALSATLLELAGQGLLAEPAGRLLDLGPAGEAGWPAALARLERLGHGSGRAYAAGIGATAALLAT